MNIFKNEFFMVGFWIFFLWLIVPVLSIIFFSALFVFYYIYSAKLAIDKLFKFIAGANT